MSVSSFPFFERIFISIWSRAGVFSHRVTVILLLDSYSKCVLEYRIFRYSKNTRYGEPYLDILDTQMEANHYLVFCLKSLLPPHYPWLQHQPSVLYCF